MDGYTENHHKLDLWGEKNNLGLLILIKKKEKKNTQYFFSGLLLYVALNPDSVARFCRLMKSHYSRNHYRILILNKSIPSNY